MRKCCCCISVHVGATILGLIGFLICALELAVLVPYLFEIDPEVFNPVQQNLEDFYFVLEKTLKENQIDKDTIDEVLKNLKEYLWPAFLGMFSNFLQIKKKICFVRSFIENRWFLKIALYFHKFINAAQEKYFLNYKFIQFT